jgi:uncharacterized damage-inducible protein DinB
MAARGALIVVIEPRPPLTYADVPREADERTTLTGFLEWQRATLAKKCEGLTDDQLRLRAVPPSTLSLLGLVRHMAEVERVWFRVRLNKESIDALYSKESDEDADFNDVDTADVAEAFRSWREECQHARDIASRFDLDDTGRNLETGRVMSLRWTLVHMIDEYSRHNGHADLLRQCIDGAVGYD